MEQMVSTGKQMEDIHQALVSVVLSQDYQVQMFGLVDDDFEPIPGSQIIEIQTPSEEERKELVKLIKREAKQRGVSAKSAGSSGPHLRVKLEQEQEKVEV